MSSHFPFAQRLWETLEILFAMLQGKGYEGRSLEEEVRAVAHRITGENLIALDIGANKGVWTTTLLALAGARIQRLFLFEPSPTNLLALFSIDDPRVTVVPKAVGSITRSVQLYSDVPGSPLGSVYNRKMEHLGGITMASELVHVITLDAFAAEQGLDHIDFMKVDVEGHELAVLEGAMGLLTARKIKALSFEFGGCAIDARTYFRDFWCFLKNLDFSIYRITPNGGTTLLERYKETDELFRTTNYLAILNTPVETQVAFNQEHGSISAA